MKVRSFIDKLRKDNITMLASVVAWGVLSSIIPILVGLIAISSIVLRDAVRQRIVIRALSRALKHVLTTGDLAMLVRVVVQHSGVLGALGVLGVFWGASNVGGAISTVFQPIFQVRGRPFIQEKLIDIGMLFVFTILMLVIIIGTTAGTLLNRLLSKAPLDTEISFVIGTAVSLLAAFLLFFVIYAVLPNIRPNFRARHVWKGACIGAILFESLTYIWPLYVHFFHPHRYGTTLAPIVVLGVWIYFFALILVLGAEVVAFGALNQARSSGHHTIGPVPDGTVPQRMDPNLDALERSTAESHATGDRGEISI